MRVEGEFHECFLVICVYLGRHLQTVSAVFSASPGLALPASQLIEHRRPTAPVRVLTGGREECRDLRPAPLGLSFRQGDGLGDGLAGHCERQG